MRASSAADAVEVFRSRRVAVLACLTPAYVELRGYTPSPAPHPFALAKGETVRLRGESQIGLSVIEEYEIHQAPDGGWQTRVVAYLYAIEQAGSELLAYHWHPRGRSAITRPHLHVRADIKIGERWLGKVHLPTGPVELEDVVALAIEELGVEPLRRGLGAVAAAVANYSRRSRRAPGWTLRAHSHTAVDDLRGQSRRAGSSGGYELGRSC